MICPDDMAFAELCDKVGKGKVTEADNQFLKSRINRHHFRKFE